MTITAFAEIIGTLLGYSQTDKRSHPYDVWLVGDALRSAKIKDYVDLHGDSVLGQFCLPIIFDVNFDEGRNRNYIDLKTQIIGLSNNKGIIQVTLPQEEDDDFIIREAGMNAVYGNLIEGAWPAKKCWLEGLRIYFYQLDPQQQKIMVKAIPSLFYWTQTSGEDLIFFDSELPQPADFTAFMIEGARAWFEEQKYYPDNRTNQGIERSVPQPRQILNAGLPGGPQGGVGGVL